MARSLPETGTRVLEGTVLLTASLLELSYSLVLMMSMFLTLEEILAMV